MKNKHYKKIHLTSKELSQITKIHFNIPIWLAYPVWFVSITINIIIEKIRGIK